MLAKPISGPQILASIRTTLENQLAGQKNPNFSLRRSGIEARTCFLESSEVMLILLVLGPQSENFYISRIWLHRKIMQKSSHSKQFSEFNSICLRDILSEN